MCKNDEVQYEGDTNCYSRRYNNINSYTALVADRREARCPADNEGSTEWASRVYGLVGNQDLNGAFVFVEFAEWLI